MKAGRHAGKWLPENRKKAALHTCLRADAYAAFIVRLEENVADG